MRTSHDEPNANMEDIPSLEPIFCKATTQVDFHEEEMESIHINMFSIVHENRITSEAGTQANISFKK